MADLQVDYVSLDRVHTALSRIAAEFEQMERHRDEVGEIWGSVHIRKAMSGFAGNWDRHRRGLLESVRSVGEMCAATATTFRDVERGLAGSLTVGPQDGPP
ncbi:hypothetical protein GCM10009547_10700 [Sporichthya brevicatena]|uniref:WXG100 family type VII secretion target n=1 Tax=Sporichthya brevicatena TaxID=171442 RepID=A0ABN1GFN0_9ACTN